MGAGAGLLSSACVGPVVVSILVSIAAGTSEVSLVTALLAATKMMFFGMGVGVPLLLIGVFGMALPKGGSWMVRVQQAFGALIAWFATGYIIKGLSGAGFDEGMSWSLLSGVALVAGAVFYAHGQESTVEERTKRAVLVVVGVIGFFVVGRSMLGVAPATASVAQGAGSLGAPATETHGNLTWHLDKKRAYDVAAQTGKPVFADFHGDWCTNCKAFQERTLADQQLNEALSRAVLLKVRDTTALFEEYRRDPRFPELKVGLPFFFITDAKDQLLYKTSDYTKSKEMALFLSEPEL
jgi:thiol:disulfide interchange protein DsbD